MIVMTFSAVRRGADMLDEFFDGDPSWDENIDLDRLSLTSERDCVLGQLFHNDLYREFGVSGFSTGVAATREHRARWLWSGISWFGFMHSPLVAPLSIVTSFWFFTGMDALTLKPSVAPWFLAAAAVSALTLARLFMLKTRWRMLIRSRQRARARTAEADVLAAAAEIVDSVDVDEVHENLE